MSTKTLQENYSSTDNRKVVISNQEVTTRKWRFDSIFKVIAAILYGFFFGMLPASFIFNSSIDAAKPDSFEISAIVGLLVMCSLSLALIFWAFKGDIKKNHPFSYWIVHILNSIMASVGIVVVTLLQPDTFVSSKLNDERFMLLALCSVAWAVVSVLSIFIVLFVFRKQYPLSWSRFAFVAFSFLFAGVSHIFLWVGVSSEMDGSSTSSTIFMVLGLVSLVIAILVFGLGISFVRRFRDVLLGERTDYEIDTIRDWESSRIMAIVMSSVMIITFASALIIQSSTLVSFNEMTLFIELGIDAILVLPYIILISVIKTRNVKNANKNIVVSKLFKTIDNGLLLDIFSWIIIVKAVILQGVLVNNEGLNVELKSLLLILGVGSLVLLYGFTTIIQLNVPNLRNTAITIPTLAFALISALFVLLFAGYLYVGTTENLSRWVFVFMPLVPAVGMSISLIIKILVVAKIFKADWKTYEDVDKSQLAKEQQNEKNDFIGERTEAIDLDELQKDKESIKAGETKKTETIQDFRNALNESTRG